MTSQGIENRQKRAESVWLQMWELYTDPINPMKVEEIRNIIKKPDGKKYTRPYIHMAFKKLKARGLIT
jgi:hypothetical protein